MNRTSQHIGPQHDGGFELDPGTTCKGLSFAAQVLCSSSREMSTSTCQSSPAGSDCCPTSKSLQGMAYAHGWQLTATFENQRSTYRVVEGLASSDAFDIHDLRGAEERRHDGATNFANGTSLAGGTSALPIQEGACLSHFHDVTLSGSPRPSLPAHDDSKREQRDFVQPEKMEASATDEHDINELSSHPHLF